MHAVYSKIKRLKQKCICFDEYLEAADEVLIKNMNIYKIKNNLKEAFIIDLIVLTNAIKAYESIIPRNDEEKTFLELMISQYKTRVVDDAEMLINIAYELRALAAEIRKTCENKLLVILNHEECIKEIAATLAGKLS